MEGRKPPLTPAARGASLLPEWQADSIIPGRPAAKARRARPQSAPVGRRRIVEKENVAASDGPMVGRGATNSGRAVVLPPDFKPFRAFRNGW